eukprot:1195974-Amphidinium_carterae.1
MTSSKWAMLLCEQDSTTTQPMTPLSAWLLKPTTGHQVEKSENQDVHVERVHTGRTSRTSTISWSLPHKQCYDADRESERNESPRMCSLAQVHWTSPN